jgi:lycopene cyclase domain-containing protein
MKFAGQYLYLWVDAGCVLFPFLLSFERRVRFFHRWKALLAGTIGMMALFIPWDAFFTHKGIWGFNDNYLSGPSLIGLPLEEWLFFICIPYACIFSYECVRYFKPDFHGARFTTIAGYGIALTALILAVTHIDRWYTLSACLLCAGLVIAHLAIWRSPWLGRALLTWFILLIPFYLSNGILTGIEFWKYPLWNNSPDQIADQIVWYNNAHNTGIRIWTVPVEDFFYGLLMFLLVLTGYERISRLPEKVHIPRSTTTGK